MKIGATYCLIQPLPEVTAGPGLHKDCYSFNPVTTPRTTISGWVGSTAQLVGIEHSPVCTNFYYYFKNKDITVLLIDEFEDPDHFFAEYFHNTPRLWRELNGSI